MNLIRIQSLHYEVVKGMMNLLVNLLVSLLMSLMNLLRKFRRFEMTELLLAYLWKMVEIYKNH